MNFSPSRILHGKRAPGARRARLVIEELENRLVPSTSPIGYTPAEMRAAYGFPEGLNGAGQTIAIIGAYHSPTLASDLAKFSNQFNLPQANLQVVSYTNRTSSDWAAEAALDVQWVHAMAPLAKIVVVEARSNRIGDLAQAVTDSITKYGATVVSMSWGTDEFPEQNAYDQAIFAPHASNGVTFVASSGDDGKVSWPAISPYVVSIGGTTLSASNESAWSNGYGNSGGGVSKYTPQPDYQNDPAFSDQFTGNMRTNPDVAYNADPNTGVPVYIAGEWRQFGGTSAGAPQWAGLIALANQARAGNNLGTLSGFSQVLPGLYALAKSNYTGSFTDITAGNRAAAGYDLATGLGTPRAGSIISFLSTTGSSSANATSSDAGAGKNNGNKSKPKAIQQNNDNGLGSNDPANLVRLINGLEINRAAVLTQVQPILLIRPNLIPSLPVASLPITLPGMTRGLDFSPVYLGGGGSGGVREEDLAPRTISPPTIVPPAPPPVRQQIAPEPLLNPIPRMREAEMEDQDNSAATPNLDPIERLFEETPIMLPLSENLGAGLFAGVILGLNWNLLIRGAEDTRRKNSLSAQQQKPAKKAE